MTRSRRKDDIRRIVSEKEISTQRELTDELNRLGHSVSQATVSRDIAGMNLIKQADADGKYVYRINTSNLTEVAKSRRIFKNSVVSVEHSLNLVVIKTMSGGANAAAVFVDELKNPMILGTISGDDTVLVIADKIESAPTLAALFRKHMA